MPQMDLTDEEAKLVLESRRKYAARQNYVLGFHAAGEWLVRLGEIAGGGSGDEHIIENGRAVVREACRLASNLGEINI
jgi:hypothetical protein